MVRSYIEQVVDIAGGKAAQQGYGLLRRFPALVKGLISPGIVEGGGSLKQSPGALCCRNLVVSQRRVIPQSVANPGIDQTVGLIVLDHVIQLLALGKGEGTRGVEPYEAELPELCENFLYLGLDLVFKAAGIVLGGVVREIPVIGPGHVAAV